jgi:bifunctional ADP-heptose synthase (sugar kinase/adenylyltransferase)
VIVTQNNGVTPAFPSWDDNFFFDLDFPTLSADSPTFPRREDAMLTESLVEAILTALPGKTVGLLGDLFLDRYLDLDAALTEPSVETGLDAYQVVQVRSCPGALGTVISNLAALGVGRIRPLALIGDDGEGYELLQALRALKVVELEGVLVDAGRRTPTYTKPMLHERGKPPRELNRLDIKNRSPTPAVAEERFLAALDRLWPACDAWVVLDQVSEADCGVVTGRVRERLARLAEADPYRFVLADSRERIGEFRHVSVKPNGAELERALRLECSERRTADAGVATLVQRLAEKVGGSVFCTRGVLSTLVAHPKADGSGWEQAAVPAYPVEGPTDPVGAGDSVSAGITCAVLAGATPAQAAAFGNLVAAITVRQLGTTGTASPSQVRARVREL